MLSGALRFCLVALAFFCRIKAETENASCEPLALLQHQANHGSPTSAGGARDPRACPDGEHLCGLRAAVAQLPNGSHIEKNWEATRWSLDEATGKLVPLDEKTLRTVRVALIGDLMNDYQTALSAVLASKEREVEEMQKLKNLPDPWVSFFLELGLGALFAPVSGALKSSSLIENLNQAVAQDMMKYVISAAEKTPTKIGMDNLNAAMKLKFRSSPAKQFLHDMAEENRKRSVNIRSHLGHLTEDERYSLYVSYCPEVASRKHLEDMVDNAFEVWDTQVKGLGWRVSSHLGQGGVEVTSVKWEGIVQVDMDVSGGKWIENSPNYRQTWKKLMVNPYARVRNDGDPELSSWQNPEIVSFVDEWTYPGLKDAEGHRHPKIPESFTGIWTGPFSHRNECDGNCCDASGYCSCPGCLRRSRSVKFSQIFKLNARGKEPGESCSADGDCLMNACAWSGNKGVRKKRCCVDKDAYKWYGASGSYCLDQPKDWDCDDDVVCAKGLYCAKSGTEGHSFCREAALKPGDLCDNQHSACTTKACARVGYPDWQWQCCITEDSYKTYFSRQWCINQPEGYPCDVDSVCGTGLTCQKIPATKGGSKGMTYSCQRPSMKAPRAATRSMKKRSQKKWPKKR